MLKFEFLGGEEVVKKLASIEPKIHASLLDTITRLSIELQANIKQNKLSGQVLKTKTGTLRRSINMRVEQSSNAIVGRVGIGQDAKKYGSMHEYGFRGTESVRAHLRTIKKAWGRPIPEKQIAVSPFTRTVDFPERSFMRTALRDMKPEIISAIDKALKV